MLKMSMDSLECLTNLIENILPEGRTEKCLYFQAISNFLSDLDFDRVK